MLLAKYNGSKTPRLAYLEDLQLHRKLNNYLSGFGGFQDLQKIQHL